MKVLIENGVLVADAATKGAELTGIRLKSDGTEYLWQADPKYWARQAPLLFPIVGAVAGNKYSFGGREYAMKNHGFARDKEFALAECTPSAAAFRLVSDEETYETYPFRFTLDIGYKLLANAVEVRYGVLNGDTKDMWFSIGAHPAFNCPLVPGQPFEEYYLEFGETETLDRQFVNAENLLMAGRREPFLRNERIKKLTKGMFAEGAYIFDAARSASVALKGRNTKKSVTVRFPGFPYLGIWAPDGAPFVCIEPWHGISEATDFKGDLTRKRGVLKLGPGEAFESKYEIIVT